MSLDPCLFFFGSLRLYKVFVDLCQCMIELGWFFENLLSDIIDSLDDITIDEFDRETE